LHTCDLSVKTTKQAIINFKIAVAKPLIVKLYIGMNIEKT